MMKNVIAYFSIIHKPKVTIFDDESISIRFVGQWTPRWAHTINHVEI